MVVPFRLDGQRYGAPITLVREVGYMQAATRLPLTPDWVEGVVDLRGEVLPVINLRRRLGLPEKALTAETRLMVLASSERSVALIVDEVDTVTILSDEQIGQPDAGLLPGAEEYLTGVARTGDGLILLIDLVRLLGFAAV
ncbi:MAG TPA: chemotaxis protein CheW [Symbiobacteriaceae bacterium]|nr:chemotaxis protein CheW [Symbiobacteriaceae bacterium]